MITEEMVEKALVTYYGHGGGPTGSMRAALEAVAGDIAVAAIAQHYGEPLPSLGKGE